MNDLNKIKKDEIYKAYITSKKILKNAYSNGGINAGETHFSDVWLRDSCFAAWGAIKLEDYEIIEEFLMNCIKNMKDNGQCPLRVGQKYFMLKFLNMKGPSGPTYIEDKYISIPVDANALFVILASKFILKTNNKHFLKTYYNDIKKALEWYKTTSKNGLVYEGPYAGWADSVKKKGHVLYSNILYCHAIKTVADLAEYFEKLDDQQSYLNQYDRIKAEIENVFWNGAYLNDWVNEKETNNQLSIDGNTLAIIFNVIDTEKQIRVLTEIKKRQMITEFGAKLIDGNYKSKDVYTPFLFIGLKDYHNGLLWLWVSCICSVAFVKNNFIEDGTNLIYSLATLINKEGTVYEVYEKSGEPVNRLVYKSEKGFAWSAGLFVWAYESLFPSSPK